MPIVLYKTHYDEFDPSKNGGEATQTIESGVLHSFIPKVRAKTAELGGERYFRFCFKEKETDVLNVGICVLPTASEKEEVYLFKTYAEFENEIDKQNIRLYGGFKISALDQVNKKVIADKVVENFVKAGDIVTFYNSDNTRIAACEIESVNEFELILKNWPDKEIKIEDFGGSTIMYDFLKAESLTYLWIKEVIPPYTSAMEIPPNSFKLNIWYEYF